MTNEIFMDGYIGQDLKNALLLLLNGIKEHKIIPDFIKLSNITSIYKQNNKSRYDIENDRGIFILTAMRKLLDNLIYNDKNPYIDSGMTDSNIGARKERNIKDHLFMVHGIINSVVQGDDDCIDIQIYDIEKCFDALWLEDCLNVIETLPGDKCDDEIALVYEASKVNLVGSSGMSILSDSYRLVSSSWETRKFESQSLW